MIDPLMLIIIILLVGLVFAGSRQGFNSVFNVVIAVLLIALVLRLLGIV